MSICLLWPCRARPVCRLCESQWCLATSIPIGQQQHGWDSVCCTDDNLLKTFISVWPPALMISFMCLDPPGSVLGIIYEMAE